MKKASIVIVTYNSAAVIENCLGSISVGIEVFVVDNASSDETCTLIKEKFPHINLIKNEENVGFGRANNLALRQVKTEFALVLNPDTVLQENSIKNLLIAADKYEDAAIIAPVLYHEDGTMQQSYKTDVFAREKNRCKYIEPGGDLCADFLSGAVMLLRISSFNDIGFFDENIFLFYEDDDICLKAKKAGHSLVMAKNAKVMHMLGKSSPATISSIYFKNKHLIWSRIYLQAKYKSKLSAKMMAIRLALINFIKLLAYGFIFNKIKFVKTWGRLVGAVLGGRG